MINIEFRNTHNQSLRQGRDVYNIVVLVALRALKNTSNFQVIRYLSLQNNQHRLEGPTSPILLSLQKFPQRNRIFTQSLTKLSTESVPGQSRSNLSSVVSITRLHSRVGATKAWRSISISPNTFMVCNGETYIYFIYFHEKTPLRRLFVSRKFHHDQAGDRNRAALMEATDAAINSLLNIFTAKVYTCMPSIAGLAQTTKGRNDSIDNTVTTHLPEKYKRIIRISNRIIRTSAKKGSTYRDDDDDDDDDNDNDNDNNNNNNT
ncbi:hypothetical protein ANN_09349 [Periplaneta americana]|uniref:Uncharacterized protein n=1 Tax=Periplaneta americana TaxID=6978 RepID=A0ABQ8TLF6_PERAM|nr:hypothetical protein ANN_09349 [Periplaneta americana]